MNKIEKIKTMAVSIAENMSRILYDVNERTSEPDKIDLEKDKINTNDFFIAELLGFRAQFELLTGKTDEDFIDFIGVLNKLAVQYILDSQPTKENLEND